MKENLIPQIFMNRNSSMAKKVDFLKTAKGSK